jgi:hypothetical protein
MRDLRCNGSPWVAEDPTFTKGGRLRKLKSGAAQAPKPERRLRRRTLTRAAPRLVIYRSRGSVNEDAGPRLRNGWWPKTEGPLVSVLFPWAAGGASFPGRTASICKCIAVR